MFKSSRTRTQILNIRTFCLGRPASFQWRRSARRFTDALSPIQHIGLARQKLVQLQALGAIAEHEALLACSVHAEVRLNGGAHQILVAVLSLPHLLHGQAVEGERSFDQCIVDVRRSAASDGRSGFATYIGTDCRGGRG